MLVAALSVLVSCSPRSGSPVALVRGPVVVVGVDGLEWDVVLPLIREGRMPTLEGLMRRGTFGQLTTLAPAKSPVVWTTVVTGKQPAKHGILDFTRLVESGDRVLYTSADRTTKALWNILSDDDQSSVVVGWWTTFPAESISGVMVSQANTRERVVRRRLLKPGGIELGVVGQVHPVSLEDEVFTVVEEVDRELPELLDRLFPEAAPGDSPSDAQEWESCRWSIRADESVRRIALRLARTDPFPALLLVYFGTPDVVGHGFWRYHAPQAFRHPPSVARIRKLGGVVTRAYEHLDTVLGELIAEIPTEATVFVISDHGMQAKRVDETFDVQANSRGERESGGHGSGPPGLIVAAGPSLRRAGDEEAIRQLTRADLPWIGDMTDIAPTILALRGIPIGRDMDGSILENLFRPEVLEALDPEFVATHDTPEWLAAQRSLSEVEPPGSEERLEQLRALGYLD